MFRETRAYPLLVQIFSRPGEFPFELAGDVVTQDLGRILASVSGGEVSGMTALIENEHANDYVRALAMEGMVSLVTTGQRTRDEVMSYFLRLFQRLERKPGAHWDGLAHVCADLWPQEAIEELGRAYEDGLVDTGSIDWQDVEHALALGQHGAMQGARYRDPVITDVAKDMGWMRAFTSGNGNTKVKEIPKKTCWSRCRAGIRLYPFAAPRPRSVAMSPVPAAAARNSKNAAGPIEHPSCGGGVVPTPVGCSFLALLVIQQYVPSTGREVTRRVGSVGRYLCGRRHPADMRTDRCEAFCRWQSGW